jgi:hypothetical protein
MTIEIEEVKVLAEERIGSEESIYEGHGGVFIHFFLTYFSPLLPSPPLSSPVALVTTSPVPLLHLSGLCLSFSPHYEIKPRPLKIAK